MERTKKNKLDILVLGRATIDINPADFSHSFAENASFCKYVGGSSANTAVGLAKLGLRVGFMGCVSRDSLGDYVISYLKENGVDTSGMVRAENGALLGLAFTEVKDGATNLMMYRNDQVADLQLKCTDVEEETIASADYLLVNGTSLSASPSREAALKAILLARKNGVKVAFDLDYRPQVWKNKDEVSLYNLVPEEEKSAPSVAVEMHCGSQRGYFCVHRKAFDSTER